MVKVKRFRVLAMTVAATLVLGVFANGSSVASTGSGEKEDAKIAVLLPGSLTDSGYGLAAKNGVRDIKKRFGVDVTVSEKVQPADFVDTMRDYADRDFDLILATGVQFQDAAAQVGAEFPDTSFVIIDGFQSAPPNVAVVDYRYEQAGFLGGLAAAVVTKSGKVAAVGGDQIPPIERLLFGFEQGVEAADPDVEVATSYVGDLFDPVKTKQVSDALAADGADVLWVVTVGGTPGAIQSIRENEILGIGYGDDSYELAPNYIVTTTLVDTRKTIVDMTKRFLDGKLKGKTYKSGFKQKVFGLADFRDLATPEQEERIRQLEKDAKSGNLPIEALTL
ncbi:MAG: BMP family protein [Actinomycetota bacterium]